MLNSAEEAKAEHLLCCYFCHFFEVIKLTFTLDKSIFLVGVTTQGSFRNPKGVRGRSSRHRCNFTAFKKYACLGIFCLISA